MEYRHCRMSRRILRKRSVLAGTSSTDRGRRPWAARPAIKAR
jgi:hypothetical protein